MKKLQSGEYVCKYCGKKFEYRSTGSNHEDYCGLSSLDRFDESGEIRKLHAMNTAQRSNNYDLNDTITDESVQVTLRNRKIGKNLNRTKEV